MPIRFISTALSAFPPGAEAGPRRRPGGGAVRHHAGAADRSRRGDRESQASAASWVSTAPWASTNRSTSTCENSQDGERGVVIYAYMAHHQGMSLLALDDVLHRDVMQQRFHGDVRVRAMESLLFERIPITRPPAEAVEASSAPPRSVGSERRAGRSHLEGRHRHSARASSRQRTLCADGDQLRRRLQPLERVRSDPMALATPRSIAGAASSISAICARSGLVRGSSTGGRRPDAAQSDHGSLFRGSRRVHTGASPASKPSWT